MKKILFVEDDPLVTRIYTQKLTEGGFNVAAAEDGLAAMKQLPIFRPDLVVLDLMMPKLSGVDVLKFMRQHPDLKTVPVVVLSNEYLNKLGEQASGMGADDILPKTTATPALLIAAIQKALARSAAPPPVPKPRRIPTAPLPVPSLPDLSPAAGFAPTLPADRDESGPAFRKRIRRDFFEQLPVISKSLRQVCDEFLAAPATAQLLRLESLSRKIGFVTHMTSMAGCYRIAQLCSAFEALLFELQDDPAFINESCRRTIHSTVHFMADCLERADQVDEQCLSPTNVLVVDDDIVSNRALALALTRAKLVAQTIVDPFEALKKLRDNSYDVVLLDINLPGISGISVCEQMRGLPGHRETPVIFFTSHAEFESRARSVIGSGDDFISKPILPIELTVKITTHVLKRRQAKQLRPREGDGKSSGATAH